MDFKPRTLLWEKNHQEKMGFEFESILAPVVQMREEVEGHIINMARTHKMMSACPCIECFSDIVHDFIYEKYEAPFAGGLRPFQR
jgi:hypothetical protein